VTTPKASLKPHLGDIRAWVAQGRTDIWIAHTLNSTPASISAFRSAHGILRRNLPGEVAGTAVPPPVVPPDAKEPEPVPKPRRRSRRRSGAAADGTKPPRAAATADQASAGEAPKRRSRARRSTTPAGEAAAQAAEAAAPADSAPAAAECPSRRRSRRGAAAAEPAAETAAPAQPAAPADSAPVEETAPRRRRRSSRGGRGRRTAHVFEAVLDHGQDGFGFWLDGAVRDDSLFREHWGGRRALVVTIEADQIVVRPDERPASPADGG
jgi:hypothetical protein